MDNWQGDEWYSFTQKITSSLKKDSDNTIDSISHFSLKLYLKLNYLMNRSYPSTNNNQSTKFLPKKLLTL